MITSTNPPILMLFFFCNFQLVCCCNSDETNLPTNLDENLERVLLGSPFYLLQPGDEPEISRNPLKFRAYQSSHSRCKDQPLATRQREVPHPTHKDGLSRIQTRCQAIIQLRGFLSLDLSVYEYSPCSKAYFFGFLPLRWASPPDVCRHGQSHRVDRSLNCGGPLISVGR